MFEGAQPPPGQWPGSPARISGKKLWVIADQQSPGHYVFLDLRETRHGRIEDIVGFVIIDRADLSQQAIRVFGPEGVPVARP